MAQNRRQPVPYDLDMIRDFFEQLQCEAAIADRELNRRTSNATYKALIKQRQKLLRKHTRLIPPLDVANGITHGLEYTVDDLLGWVQDILGWLDQLKHPAKARSKTGK